MTISCNIVIYYMIWFINVVDIIGVIEKDIPIRRITNKHGIAQSQLKLEITDGRYMMLKAIFKFYKLISK